MRLPWRVQHSRTHREDFVDYEASDAVLHARTFVVESASPFSLQLVLASSDQFEIQLTFRGIKDAPLRCLQSSTGHRALWEANLQHYRHALVFTPSECACVHAQVC